MKKFIVFSLITFCIAHLNALDYSPLLMIKIPTRSRPQQFFHFLDRYYENLSDNINVFFVITCDNDDPSMNNEIVKSEFKKYKHLYVYFGDSKSKIEACNNDIARHDFDIVLLASDDMFPIVKGYDEIIVQYMLEYFPDLDGVLNFHDGIYGADLNSMPIIGKKYYDRFGYIYHPDYKSWWCDCELSIIAKLLGKEKTSDKILLKHMQLILWERDPLYKINMKHAEEDKKTFFKRKERYFDLDTSIVASLNSDQLAFFRLYDKW